MKPLKDLLKPPTTASRDTERGQLLCYFQAKINAGRKGTKYRPLSIKRVGILLGGLKLPDLYYMKSVFEDTERRRGLQAAMKEFYWSLKEIKIGPEF